MAKGGDIIELGKALNTRIAKLQEALPVGVDIGVATSQPEAVARSVKAFTQAWPKR